MALARIMAYEPDVILLDEPFSALDMYLKDQLQQELIEMLEDYEGTVIMVSHNRDEVYRFSQELLVIDQGKVSASGETKELFKNPVSKEAARLTGCKNFSRIRRLDAHTAQALDWGITLHIQREIPAETEWFGYRAHDFIPVWGEREENTIRFELESSALLPFERNYYLYPESGDTPGKTSGDAQGEVLEAQEERKVLCWFVQREKADQLDERGYPDYLRFQEDKILFLVTVQP